jgi:O-antigen ligase
MFAIPGLVLLVLLIYVRPHEVIEPLKELPLLYFAFGLAVFGFIIDVRLRKTELMRSPHLLWVAAFCVWALVTGISRAPRQAPALVLDLAIPVVLYLVIAHGLQGFRALHVVGGVVLGVVLFVAAVGVHQGFQPTGCVQVDETVLDTSAGKYDGRSCENVYDCYLGDAEPGAQYRCEKIGLLGTTSISKGRIRYRGVLQDPNELALATGIGVPLVFAVGRRKRLVSRSFLIALTIALVVFCAILTGSRGGQLVVLAVFGAYFVKRFGWKGVTLGVIMAAPLLLFGGRGGAEADTSTGERIECWYVAVSLFRSNPLFGVGFRQFDEYHYLTAHNSYLLALAEMGFVGLLLFSVLIYLSIKTPYAVLKRYPPPGTTGAAEDAAEPEIARAWAMAILASFTGLSVGMFFLSFTYHYVLWIYFGLVGALYCATRRHDPSFKVALTGRELLALSAFNAALVAVVFVFTRSAV